MKKRLVICDRDERYRQRMQAYLIKRLKDFEILTFDSLERATGYSKNEAFAILLVSEQLYETDLQKIQAVQTFILRENGAKAVTEYPYIEKYQSIENLIGDIFAEYLEENVSHLSVRQRKTVLHTFYSPVRKTEQTKAAIALGQVLAKMDKKVLYLNLQPFVSWEDTDQNVSADITDLLYFMRKQNSNCEYRLQSMKRSLGGMDYLAPAADYMDLLMVTEQEWLKLLDLLEQAGDYQEIILDLSEICQGLYRFLEQSDCIYSMSGTLDTEKGSIHQYRKLLEKREQFSILDKTNWLEMPRGSFEQAVSLERMYATPLGEYMKGLVRENGNRQI